MPTGTACTDVASERAVGPGLGRSENGKVEIAKGFPAYQEIARTRVDGSGPPVSLRTGVLPRPSPGRPDVVRPLAMHPSPEGAPDIRERGSDADGQPIRLDRRLFVQLLAFEREPGLSESAAVQVLGDALVQNKVGAVIYQDLNHPDGLAVLSFSEQPEDFVHKVRPIYQISELARLRPRPGFSMIGRTYSTGYERDLELWLLRRPRETLLNQAWRWAIWYPLRRKGAFERLEPRERAEILKEHGGIGRSYGESDLAHDIRLACHGLDANDNDFVIGLLGKSLHPLSHVVQSMRKTRQTSEFMEQMGPFFTGYAVRWVAG